jgi:hypothetical protein
MGNTIPFEPETVALSDARNREVVGRLISRVLRPRCRIAAHMPR